MRHLFYTLPYAAIYMIAALFISKSQTTQEFLTIVVLAAISFAMIRGFLLKNGQSIEQSFSGLFQGGSDTYIDSFKFPSTVVYRVRNKYDISLEEVHNAEKDIQTIFKNALNSLNSGKQPTFSDSIHPMSYIFWNELYQTGELYKNFCQKAIGQFVTPPFSKIHQAESSLNTLTPTLKTYSYS